MISNIKLFKIIIIQIFVTYNLIYCNEIQYLKVYNDPIKSCEFQTDNYNCFNIICQGIKSITEMTNTLKELIDRSLILDGSQIFCSIDLSNTYIHDLNKYFYLNFNTFIKSMKEKVQKESFKMSFSNLRKIQQFNFTSNLNLIIYIYDSFVYEINSKIFEKNKNIDLNLVNFTTYSNNWFNLLDSSTINVLSLRFINDLTNITFRNNYFSSSIREIKILNSNIVYLNESFFLFKLLKYTEQIELINCDIEEIQDGLFENYDFISRNLKILILSNNNIQKITRKTFYGLKNLLLLDLDNNPIEFIDRNAFESLKVLETLSLNNNIKFDYIYYDPIWFYSLLNSDSFKYSKSLKKISFANENSILNICYLSSLIDSINNYQNKTTSNKFYHRKRKKFIKLFPRKLDLVQLYNKLKLDEFKCNIYFVCKYMEKQRKISNLIFQIESVDFCKSYHNLFDNSSLRCNFNQNIKKCKYDSDSKGIFLLKFLSFKGYLFIKI
jgi:hypothetical protein